VGLVVVAKSKATSQHTTPFPHLSTPSPRTTNSMTLIDHRCSFSSSNLLVLVLGVGEEYPPSPIIASDFDGGIGLVLGVELGLVLGVLPGDLLVKLGLLLGWVFGLRLFTFRQVLFGPSSIKSRWESSSLKIFPLCISESLYV